MADDLVRDQRVEMRVGNDRDFAVGWLQDRRGGQLARLGRQVDAKFARSGIRHQLVAPSVAQAFKAALLADSVVAFLVAVADLRNDVTIALRKGERLRDHRARGIDENLVAQLGHRGHHLNAIASPSAAT